MRIVAASRPAIRLLRKLAWCACAAACMPGAAAPAPGAVISNQASAISPNLNGGRAAAASNIVQASVGQLAGFTLTADSSATALPSSTVFFPHVLVNTGNGSDRFTLAATQLPGDFVFSSLHIFADANGDGQPDNPVALTGSADLAPQATFRFVVAAQVPAGVSSASGAGARLRIDATSGQDPTCSSAKATFAALTDTVTLGKGALLTLAKTVSQPSATGGDTVAYTLLVHNTGAGAALRGPDILIDGLAASPVLVRDAIPANTTLAAVAAPLPGGAIALYHKAGAAEHAYASAPPADLADVDAIAYALPALAPAASAALSFRVTLHANAASGGNISNTAHVDYLGDGAGPARTVASNAALLGVAQVPATIKNYTTASHAQATTYARLGAPLYLRADASACNASAGVAEQRSVIITGPHGESESYTATETGPNTGVFTVAQAATRAPVSTPVANDGVLEVASGDQIRIELLGCGSVIATTMTLADPSGTVFDSSSNAPIKGATVSLVIGDGNGGCSATRAGVRRLVDGVIEPAPSSVTTGFDGKYEFELTDDGNYCLLLAAPALFHFPSTVAAGQMQANRTLATTGPTRGGSYGNNFSVTQATGPVRIDVPLDPIAALRHTSLFVEKTASRTSVEIADFLDYTIKVRNNDAGSVGSGSGKSGVLVADSLPAGFAYQRGSMRLNGVAGADPAGSAGARLEFNIGALEPAAVATLTYRVRIVPGALQGDATNRASASSGAATSNLASVRVTVQGGVFSERGFIVGKVYQDCNGNRVQDAAEAGIPGVRVYLEDGTYAISDGEGKYSFYGIAPRTHVLKLDQTSLPQGAQPSVLSNRNAGDPGSVFVDLKNGELMKADFATASCSPQVGADIEARRASALSAATESQRTLQQRLDADGQIRPPADIKAQPASGTIGNPGNLAQAGFTPLAPTPAAPLGLEVKPRLASPAGDKNPLETLLPTLDNSFGFVGLEDGQVLPIAQTGVRIKGLAGALFDLSVNGEAVPAARIGKQSVLQEKQLQAWEYIGIALKPGPNLLLARQHDQFGNLRSSAGITVIAPDGLDRLELLLPSAAIADGRDHARVIVKLSDRHGVPVTVRTPVTLEASSGRWLAEDLDPREPGLQVFVEGGRGEFMLLAPDLPGTALVKVSSGALKEEKPLDFLPDLRPMIGAGVIEGTVNLRQIDSRALLPVRRQDSFEQELSALGQSGNDAGAGARAALFLKGRVKGDYLLTLAYDSDKATRERLFRDISPDEFYPVYGDSAVRGFDAQSTSRLYVRIDNGKSYLLYGDYTTMGNLDARKLANYSRSLTGIKQHHESPSMVSNVWVSRDSTRQAVDELRANGTSGPYLLRSANPRVNSEKVELLVRDRNQIGIVLKSVLLARFFDYEMEPLSGQLILKMPLPSLDPDFNPQSLRVTYEVEQGGAQFWVGGFDTQVKLGPRVEVGALAVHDSNTQDPVTLAGINGSIKLGEKTYLSAELARNDKQSMGTGHAGRIGFRHDGVDLQVNAQAGRADEQFDNPGSALARGRAEDSLKIAYRVDPQMLLKMEALRTEDLVNGEQRDGAYAGVLRSVGDHVRVEAGIRRASASTAATSSRLSAPAPYTSVRTRLASQLPSLPQASLYAEYEQDIANSARKVAALGGDYQLAGAGRLYLRHEFISSLSGPYALDAAQSQNATVAGIDVDYMKDGHVFSEYRIRDALAGADTEAALGLRNTWRVADGVGLTTGFERVHTLAGSGAGEATALTFGIDITASPLWKGSTRIELRHADNGDNLLHTLGLAVKLSGDWTALGRNTLVATRNKLGGARIQERMQAGLAYRETEGNRWNGLGRIEHRVEKDDSQSAAVVRRNMDLVSLHANYQPRQAWTLSGRYAAKWVIDHGNGLPGAAGARLVGARISHDIDGRWDAGVIANMLAGGGSRQRGLGFEIGYQVMRNLWLSGGYNLFGFRDADLAGADHTERGAYLRLRFKFDENLFGHAPDSAMQALR
jgi:uncharacterized repeat protein (TIGR01451 family)